MDQLQALLTDVLREGIGAKTAAIAIVIIGLNVHFGYTGLLNMGQAGFMLLGGYGFAISVAHDIPFVVAILIGFALATVFAMIIGFSALTLRGDYLAIVTIAAAEVIKILGNSERFKSLTGGSLGFPSKKYDPAFLNLSFFPHYKTWQILSFNYADVSTSAGFRIFGWLVVLALAVGLVLAGMKLASGTRKILVMVGLGVVLLLAALFMFPLTELSTGDSKVGDHVASSTGWWVVFVGWVLAAICTGIVYLLTRSPWGRMLKGIREDEDAIRSLGKNVFAVKLQALIIGGCFGALGGMVYALSLGAIKADDQARPMTFLCYTALLIGGAATLLGPIIGPVLYFFGQWTIEGIVRFYVPDSFLSDQQAEPTAYVVMGTVLMLLVIFRPQGIFGDKRELRFHV
ncbi:branched-chain amino acid ABC transporter permease [Nocardioides panacisoli]|uniref:Branched-chain amino acid ABC transporter permease n=1 Tax=Nocardioides panacisoli TaxID=627624 RepID=A0ABP7IMY9_9ACTN